ncbi:hypothetical protein [Streptomyces sp. DT171]|uniref:hypothetical protein n=1 Tax=Streptomyces sp. DT171 TaxID=3416524 RepID=UPI003CF1AA94
MPAAVLLGAAVLALGGSVVHLADASPEEKARGLAAVVTPVDQDGGSTVVTKGPKG